MDNTGRWPVLGILSILILGLFIYKGVSTLGLSSSIMGSRPKNDQVELITSKPGALMIGKNSSPGPSSNPSNKLQSSAPITSSKPSARPSISPSPSPMFLPSPSVRPSASPAPRSLSVRYIRPLLSIRPQVNPLSSPQASQSAFTRRKRNYKLQYPRPRISPAPKHTLAPTISRVYRELGYSSY